MMSVGVGAKVVGVRWSWGDMEIKVRVGLELRWVDLIHRQLLVSRLTDILLSVAYGGVGLGRM